MEIGKSIYSSLKKNNIAVLSITALCIIVTSIACLTSFLIYRESQKNLFAIGDKGNLVPLVKLNDKEDKLKQVKANLDYFVSLYYDLDGYTMKEKKEKLYWLMGTQPTTIMKDRDRKGYFNNFLSITGLVQHASINQKSWKISGYDAPYDISFDVNISVINGTTTENYISNVTVTLEETNRNYPYNPYGFILTKLSENLTKIVIENKYDNDKEQVELNNQNN
ncbi:hypothetical protein [Flavobacterium psychrophilum]|uniref:hypothetical protein n=1 Tax=Flavobacterium psychrophilum TaxID=96345 RepID=UPI00106A4512|nr:hypothetical protein [Flavobacterium psychrophilum]